MIVFSVYPVYGTFIILLIKHLLSKHQGIWYQQIRGMCLPRLITQILNYSQMKMEHRDDILYDCFSVYPVYGTFIIVQIKHLLSKHQGIWYQQIKELCLPRQITQILNWSQMT